jgi:sulfur carrier protein
MKILVNGAWLETGAPDLASALDQLGYRDAIVATAVNGEFVPVAARSCVRISEGDRIEVLAPMQGG